MFCCRSRSSCQQRGRLGGFTLVVMQRCDATVWPVVQVAALQMCFCSQVDFLHKTERSNTNRFNHTARLDFPNILGICDAQKNVFTVQSLLLF